MVRSLADRTFQLRSNARVSLLAPARPARPRSRSRHGGPREPRARALRAVLGREEARALDPVPIARRATRCRPPAVQRQPPGIFGRDDRLRGGRCRGGSLGGPRLGAILGEGLLARGRFKRGDVCARAGFVGPSAIFAARVVRWGGG